MELADRLRALTETARQAAGDHKDDLHKAAEQAAAFADRQTQGRYRDHIQKASAKVDALLERLPDPRNGPTGKDGPPTGPEPGSPG